jgi:hypothetical protein
MRILITGNMGYVGPILARHLRRTHPDAELIGFDAKYFAHCLTPARAAPEAVITAQHFGDIRDFPAELLEGVDAVVNLAAISNDPMGNKFEAGHRGHQFQGRHPPRRNGGAEGREELRVRFELQRLWRGEHQRAHRAGRGQPAHRIRALQDRDRRSARQGSTAPP